MKSSGGTPLPASERAYLEPRFGRDLSHVKIHTDDRAAKTSQAIQAKAFTVGNNIAFNKGYYKPGTHEGRKLLAHEITHTIQQTGGSKKGTGGKAKGVSRVQREVVQRQQVPQAQPNTLASALARGWRIEQLRSMIPPFGGNAQTQDTFSRQNNIMDNVIILEYRNYPGPPGHDYPMAYHIAEGGRRTLTLDNQWVLPRNNFSAGYGGYDIDVVMGETRTQSRDEQGQAVEIPTIKQLIYVNFKKGNESDDRWQLVRQSSFLAWKRGHGGIPANDRARLHPEVVTDGAGSGPAILLAYFTERTMQDGTMMYQFSRFESYDLRTGLNVASFGADGTPQANYHVGRLEATYTQALNGTWPTPSGGRQGFHMVVEPMMANNQSTTAPPTSYRAVKDRYFHYRNGAYDVPNRGRR